MSVAPGQRQLPRDTAWATSSRNRASITMLVGDRITTSKHPPDAPKSMLWIQEPKKKSAFLTTSAHGSRKPNITKLASPHLRPLEADCCKSSGYMIQWTNNNEYHIPRNTSSTVWAWRGGVLNRRNLNRCVPLCVNQKRF